MYKLGNSSDTKTGLLSATGMWRLYEYLYIVSQITMHLFVKD